MRADDPLRDAQAVLMSLGRLGNLVSTAIEESAGPELVGNGPAVTLVALDLQGPKRPGEIQDLTGLTSGGVSKMLDRLEQAGLLVRQYGALPQDRRGAVVRLTGKGTRAARQIGRAMLSHLDEVRVALGELDRLTDRHGGPGPAAEA